MKISSNISTLVGVGSSICGGSAIAATAPVIGADDEEIAQAISVIFLFNILAALIFPSLGSAIGLSNDGFGLFAGTAVNDVSSVTAASYRITHLFPSLLRGMNLIALVVEVYRNRSSVCKCGALSLPVSVDKLMFYHLTLCDLLLKICHRAATPDLLIQFLFVRRIKGPINIRISSVFFQISGAAV